MNIHNIKALAWLGAFGVGGYLGYDVWHFLENRAVFEKAVDQDYVQRLLYDEIEKPEPIQRQVVDPGEIMAIFHRMDWTGKPEPEKVVVASGPPLPTGPPKTPVAELLQILVIYADPGEPANSRAYVLYKDNQLKARHNEPKERFLKIGQKLTGKYEHVAVKDIQVEGVLFSFADEGREDELVGTLAYTSSAQGIVQVDPNGVIQPDRRKLIPMKGDYIAPRTLHTTEVRRNEFQVGLETVKELEKDYATILSRDLQYRVARDPSTGSVLGIQITKVAPDSIPAKAGIQSGEIVKSINGFRVTSLNDAVAYVKREAPTTDVWVVIFEKQGREFTRTYRSPVQ